MVCTSGSVAAVANKTVKAKQEIDQLQAMIQAQDGAYKATFFNAINTHLADAKVTDAREIGYNSDIKTEYTSEFSLDKIAAVVTKALKAAVAAQDPTAPAPALSKNAIEAYTEVVNAVAEAAKSSSTSSTSLSFSMNRLSPGLFSFLYAQSLNIKSVDTFGTEAVTTTAIYCRLMESIDDVKNATAFGEAVIDARNLLNMKTLQAALTDDLASGKINLDEWMKKDDAYSIAVERIKKRLAAAKFDVRRSFALTREAGYGAPIEHSFSKGSAMNQEVVSSSIQRLSKMGSAYKSVIAVSKKRLASAYF